MKDVLSRFRSIPFVVVALGACLAVRPASADELAPLLDRWANALGGRERLAEPTVIEQRLTGTMFGLDAKVRSWTALDGRVRVELDLGGGLYTFLQVFDGERGWQVDQNGKLSPVEGAELESMITSGYTDRRIQLLDASRGTIEMLDRDPEGPRVRCLPQGGKPVTFVLDPETGLPLRYEVPAQERVQVTTIRDWAEHGGILFASVWDQTEGDPQYDAHLELEAVEFHDAVDPAWFAPPQEESDDVVFIQSPPLLDIPIELNTVHIFLRCSVNGSEPLWFVLDTGASITVLSRATAERLGLDMQGKIEGRGSGEKSAEVNLVGGVTYGPEGVELRDQTVAALDLDRIEALMGRELDGILGFDFISRFVVEIDYRGRRLNLHDRKGWNYEGSGVEVPITLEGSQPHVRATLAVAGRDPVEGLFLVDTGANGAVHVGKPFTEEHDLLATLQESREYSGGYGVGGRSRSIFGRIPAFRLGGLSFVEPVCAFSLDEKGAHADPNLAGLIGGHVLRRCRVFFDYERSRMILEPHEGMDEPFGVDSLGLIATTGGREDFHRFTVLHVLADSPAEEAGLREGDEILEFDGTPAAELTAHGMWTRVQQSYDRIRLRIARNGEELEVPVQLKPLI